MLGHEVGNHGGRGRKRRGDIAFLNMLATEVDTHHVDMSSSGLIVRMERHNDSTFVVAEELGGALPEAEISKKEAQVEGFFSTLGESIVFCLLSTETDRGAELHFPTARGATSRKT